ncbi:MAG: ribosomal RNA small subunit methyltransferase H [Porticoccaceae bacterium]|nr:MAG: ribosomal RNA small subunit methyltransferase H [Porticoccaceae bacterium]
MAGGFGHEAVLLDEAVDALVTDPAGCYIDGTFGRGGHSGAILGRLGSAGRLLAIDRDPDAGRVARERFGDDSRFEFIQGSFAQLAEYARERGVEGRVAGLLLDLGVSSPQLDDPERGFSFLRDGPLDMRMDPSAGPTAAEWLARATEGEIADVLWRFGEERYARRIAAAIVRARREAPIARTARLAEIVAAACPTRERGQHPATRTFQAVRIHVNRELEALEAALAAAVEVLAPGGRLVVISFHSLEDRLVKRFIRRCQRGDAPPRGLPLPAGEPRPTLRALGRPVRPSDEECRRNRRARSAVMRVAERLGAP